MSVSTEIGFNTTTKLLLGLVRLKKSDTDTLALYAECNIARANRVVNALVELGYATVTREAINIPRGGGLRNVYSITNAGIVEINKLYQAIGSALKVDSKSYMSSHTGDFVRIGNAS